MKPQPPAPPPSFFVRPRPARAEEAQADGLLLIRDPISKAHLPAAGRLVPQSTHWIRQIAAGDVLIVAPPAPPVLHVDQIPDSKPREE